MTPKDPYTDAPEFEERTVFVVPDVPGLEALEPATTKKAARELLGQVLEKRLEVAREQQAAMAQQLGIPADQLAAPELPELEVQEATIRTVFDVVQLAAGDEPESIQVAGVNEAIAKAELERLEAQAADSEYGWRTTAENDPADKSVTPAPTFELRTRELVLEEV